MLVIDRFEGEYALIEYKRKVFHMPKALLPKGLKAGDVVTIQVALDKEATAKRKQSVDRLARDLFEK